jgi:hypothetical protein
VALTHLDEAALAPHIAEAAGRRALDVRASSGLTGKARSHTCDVAANCYDNSAVETLFKSLKAELIWWQTRPTRRQAEAAIFQSINGFYNTRRRHSYLGGISPLALEAKVA